MVSDKGAAASWARVGSANKNKDARRTQRSGVKELRIENSELRIARPEKELTVPEV